MFSFNMFMEQDQHLVIDLPCLMKWKIVYLLSDTYRMEGSNPEESMKFGMMVCFHMLFKVRRGSHSRNALVGVKWCKCGVKM